MSEELLTPIPPPAHTMTQLEKALYTSAYYALGHWMEVPPLTRWERIKERWERLKGWRFWFYNKQDFYEE